MMPEEIKVPADLKVDIRDPRIADGITPAGMQSWVRRDGWTLRHDGPHAQVWESPDHEDAVMVPLRTDFVDYANRVKDFIDAWSEVQGRSQLAVWADLRAASQEAG